MWRRRASWQRRESGGVRELVWALSPRGFSQGTLETSIFKELACWHSRFDTYTCKYLSQSGEEQDARSQAAGASGARGGEPRWTECSHALYKTR